MLKIAIPNKGALSEETITLLREAGYRCRRSGRELMLYDAGNDIEFYFLRPRDIPVYVANATLQLGITGRDLAVDAGVDFQEILPLNFGHSKFCYAAPADLEISPDQFHGKRIATSYPTLVRNDLAQRNVDASIIRLDGAVEISIQLGVADIIADVVESGRTLKEAGLSVIGEPIFRSEAILIGAAGFDANMPEVSRFCDRIRGILLARTFAIVEYDCPRSILEQACAITPGIEAPTIAPLRDENWMAVKSMVKRSDINQIIDQLSAIGAKGIIVTRIETCRI
ncbi:MAG: ATP phosphoribosyltransferase [Lentisphaerae bacterium]|nr:MAG: ATP phosphoribosyltransferase [Lentisphaerota bacterium]